MSELQEQAKVLHGALEAMQWRLVEANTEGERQLLACEVGRLAAQLGRVHLLQSRGLTEDTTVPAAFRRAS